MNQGIHPHPPPPPPLPVRRWRAEVERIGRRRWTVYASCGALKMDPFRLRGTREQVEEKVQRFVDQMSAPTRSQVERFTVTPRTSGHTVDELAAMDDD